MATAYSIYLTPIVEIEARSIDVLSLSNDS